MTEGHNHLQKDPVLKVVITKYGDPVWHKPADLFAAIIRNIIGQQLSGGPARIILGRFVALFGHKKFPTPAEILKMPDQKLRDCGMSWAKVKYVKELAHAVASGSLDLKKVKTLPDEEVVIELTKVKGIGRWTAEMILIFHLQRPDVFSLGDLGLRTAVAKLYRVDRNNLKKIEKISRRWSPFRSLASRYLWMSLDNE
ncbi:DNA-3-methyladenine glycosylase 2 family protein [Candidatus Microgenomates bacterium]|nr:DNA-3-methyladenine glycosylase 2 family protein [Candidatus Microgenomates bacterium]